MSNDAIIQAVPTGDRIAPEGAVTNRTNNLRVTVKGGSPRFRWEYERQKDSWFNLNGSGIRADGQVTVKVKVTQEALDRHGGNVIVKIGKKDPVTFRSADQEQDWELKFDDTLGSSWNSFFMKASGVAGEDDPTYYIKKAK